jgi:hypothetical protein
MRPDQFISKLSARFPHEFRRELLLTARLIFQFQADNLYDVEFIDGRPLRQSDIIGTRLWLEQLAAAAQQEARPKGKVSA